MNAQEIYERCKAFQRQIHAAKTVAEAQAAFDAMQHVAYAQCLRCSHSEDDPKHQPRRRRLWWGSRKAECPYVPRVPVVEVPSPKASTP